LHFLSLWLHSGVTRVAAIVRAPFCLDSGFFSHATHQSIAATPWASNQGTESRAEGARVPLWRPVPRWSRCPPRLPMWEAPRPAWIPHPKGVLDGWMSRLVSKPPPPTPLAALSVRVSRFRRWVEKDVYRATELHRATEGCGGGDSNPEGTGRDSGLIVRNARGHSTDHPLFAVTPNGLFRPRPCPQVSRPGPPVQTTPTARPCVCPSG